jgi:hypothetical protein
MRKLTIALAASAALLAVGAFALKADATTWSGTTSLPGIVKNYSPVQKAACRGRGACPWGFTRVCGPRVCACVRC